MVEVRYMTNITDILNFLNNIDWSEFAPIIPILEWDMLYNHNLQTNFNSFNLLRNKRPQEMQWVSLPPELTSYYRGIDFRQVAAYKFGEEVSYFAQLMVDNFPSKNLIMLYNNINELKINTVNENINNKKETLKNFIFKRGSSSITGASYSSFHNKISIPETGGETELPHELFHMATSFRDKDKNVNFCGFEQTNKNIHQIIGTGINEGYTELMVSKYYGNDYLSDSVSYILLRTIAEVIEGIIGREKMEKFYLNANLNSLVNELSLYAEYDDVLRFISSMDFLYHNFNESFVKSEKKQQLLSDHVKSINNFIVKVGVNKPIKQLIYGEIEKSELIQCINKNVSKTFSFTFGNKKYNTAPSSEQLSNMIIYLLDKQRIDLNVNVEQKEKQDMNRL